MSKRKRLLIITLFVVVSLPVAELVREEIIYILVTRKLESAHKQISTGMTKDQIRSLVGNPDSIETNASGEVWHWDATHYQGALWKRLGLTAMKGHYGLGTVFNEAGKVIQVWGGVN